MRLEPFFPDPLFAWAFYLVLVAITAVASYTDLRGLVIPKWLTLTALGLGVAFNLVGGAWHGVKENEGLAWGASQGLAVALLGFVAGFGLFFVMWILGTCGGGDVKLFAALGAWVGPANAVIVLMGTIVFVILFSAARLVWSSLSRGVRPTVKDYTAAGAARSGKRAGKQGGPDGRRTRKRLMAYSLPVALSTTLLLPWVFREGLGLKAATPGPDDKSAQAQGTR